MNIPILLTPKCSVAFARTDESLSAGIDRLRSTGYTAIPVITPEGMYAGSLSEGDVLWRYFDAAASGLAAKELNGALVGSAINAKRNPPVAITAPMDEVCRRAMEQNFIPVVDDRGAFVGIVTRKSLIDYFYKSQR